jgi:hypothetical protein
MKFKARSPLIRPWLAPVILGRLRYLKCGNWRRRRKAALRMPNVRSRIDMSVLHNESAYGAR